MANINRPKTDHAKLDRARKDLKKAKQGLRIAKSILDYVGLDKYEREVTANDRKKFDAICEEIL